MQDASGRAEELLGRLHARISRSIVGPRAPSATPMCSAGACAAATGTTSGLDARQDDQAIAAGDFAAAAELGDFFVDEAAVIHSIYRDWIPKLIDFRRDRGVARPSSRRSTSRSSRSAQARRQPVPRASDVGRVPGQVREFVLICGRADEAAALAKMGDPQDLARPPRPRRRPHLRPHGRLRRTLRRGGHPRHVGHDGRRPLHVAVREVRHEQYSWKESLPTNLYLAMEAMRGHLVGPGRRGNFEFEEDEDRYTFRFDPCGSGGHIVRGDQEVFHTPPRPEPPYNWAVLEEEHDFALEQEGRLPATAPTAAWSCRRSRSRRSATRCGWSSRRPIPTRPTRSARGTSTRIRARCRSATTGSRREKPEQLPAPMPSEPRAAPS